MKLQVTYEWAHDANRGKTKDLDTAIKRCLSRFGFSMTNQRYDIAAGVRSLDFETEEVVTRPIGEG